MASRRTEYRFHGVKMLTSSHPEIRRIKRSDAQPSIHGNKLWKSSFLLIDYLRKNPPEHCKTVMDAGCGWGMGGIYCAKAFGSKVISVDADKDVFPYLKANAGGGLIVNISSIVGRRAMPGIGGYCASKAALEKMAESLRLELLTDNIRVSTVYPGVTVTGFNDNSLGSDQSGRGRVSGVPPERVAQAILYTIEREQRDVFITLFDRAFVTASAIWPWFMDRLLGRYLGQR